MQRVFWLCDCVFRVMTVYADLILILSNVKEFAWFAPLSALWPGYEFITRKISNGVFRAAWLPVYGRIIDTVEPYCQLNEYEFEKCEFTPL